MSRCTIARGPRADGVASAEVGNRLGPKREEKATSAVTAAACADEPGVSDEARAVLVPKPPKDDGLPSALRAAVVELMQPCNAFKFEALR